MATEILMVWSPFSAIHQKVLIQRDEPSSLVRIIYCFKFTFLRRSLSLPFRNLSKSADRWGRVCRGQRLPIYHLKTWRPSEFALKMTPLSLITENLIDPKCPPFFFGQQRGREGHPQNGFDWRRLVEVSPVSPAAPVCVPALAGGVDKWPGQKHSVNKLFNIHYYGVNIVPLDR